MSDLEKKESKKQKQQEKINRKKDLADKKVQFYLVQRNDHSIWIQTPPMQLRSDFW